MNIPDDFPHHPDLLALSGAHPKIGVRLDDGKYVSGYTPAEREQRYDVCADLVAQLVRYYERKMSQPPARTKKQLLDLLAEALRQKGWGLSSAEIEWCVGRVGSAVDSNASD